MNTNPDLLLEDAAAKYLAISVSTLKRRRYNGEIGFYQLGTRIRYSQSKHLDQYLTNCEIGVEEDEWESATSH